MSQNPYMEHVYAMVYLGIFPKMISPQLSIFVHLSTVVLLQSNDIFPHLKIGSPVIAKNV